MAFNLVVFTGLLASANAAPYLGVNVPFLENRIVGGQEAKRHEFPHQVSLQWGLPPAIPLSHFCGGTIIDSKWILTAGHCARAVPSYGTLAVKAGKHLINVDEPNEQVAVVEEIIVHQKYPGNVAPYDIALLKLRTPLKLNDIVSVIRLPLANSTFSNNLTLSGWGSVSSTNVPNYPNALQKVSLTVVDLAICKKALEGLVGSAPIHATNICTGPITGGISACSGDSGGPLIGKNKNGTLEVVGVVSWGIVPCGTRGAPSVYTRVSAFVDWINEIIEKYS